jgi:3-oxoacyl-[acyl-carrier-protein] synthase-3
MAVADAHERSRPEPGGREAAGGQGWAIRGTGAHLPRECVRSDDLSRALGLDPSWIERRTGILRRHVAAPGEAASDLAAAAADRALRAAGREAADIGLLVVGRTRVV